MILGIKDGLRLIGVAVICFCGVFVCTFFLNYYLDVLPLGDGLAEEFAALYDAQIATARFTSAIAGGVLTLTAVITLVFYIKLYIDANSRQLGILKAMGYSELRLARGFFVFGLSAFIGCSLGFAAGFAAMPFIYANMTIDGIGEVAITFHPILLVCLVALPSAFFTGLSCAYAYFVLKRPALEMIKGSGEKPKRSDKPSRKSRSFLQEMRLSAISSRKSLTFFAAFSCFCFSAMIQMGLSMEKLTSKAMGIMILLIGVTLAFVSAFMAITSLVNANRKNIAVMKVFGYGRKQCVSAVLGGYLPFALLGFALGTAYQYGLLEIMINVVFANVEAVPDYSFDVPVFFITLLLFIVTYSALTLLYVFRINKISVKEIMLET